MVERSEGMGAVRVQVCDGCCCGTDRKHPGVDHPGIRARLAAAAEAAGGTLRVVECVDECSRSNVVIVRHAGVASERTWVGGVLGGDIVDALCGWLRAGAPLPPPPIVAAQTFVRQREVPVVLEEAVVLRGAR